MFYGGRLKKGGIGKRRDRRVTRVRGRTIGNRNDIERGRTTNGNGVGKGSDGEAGKWGVGEIQKLMRGREGEG